MTKRSWQGKSIRTTITLDRKLFRETKELMLRNGFRENFSQFVEHCIREKRAKMLRQEENHNGR